MPQRTKIKEITPETLQNVSIKISSTLLPIWRVPTVQEEEMSGAKFELLLALMNWKLWQLSKIGEAVVSLN